MRDLPRKTLRRSSVLGAFAVSVMTIVAACGTDVDTNPSANVTATKSHAAQPTTPRERNGLRAAYIESVQQRASAAYAATLTDDVARLANPAQKFDTTINRQGLVVAAHKDAWHLGMHTTAVGCEGAMKPVADAKPRTENNRVTLEHDGLEEWYLNGPLGVEQGFVLEEAPACAGPKVVKMGVEGDLIARLQDEDGDGRGDLVRFVDEQGQEKLAYSDLIVKDASGKVVPAELQIAAGELSIAVDDAGAHYPLTIDPLIWVLQQQLDSPSSMGMGTTNDRFAESVSLSGNSALIGARGEDGTPGHAYVFVRSGTTWSLEADLIPQDPVLTAAFGTAVSLSGNSAAVGAPYAAGSISNVGAVYVFVRNGTMWTQQAKLLASDGTSFSALGISVAIENDRLIAGASTADGVTDTDQGAAYVFTRSGTTWTQEAKLLAADGAPIDYFGASVAISSDTAVVGAPQVDLPMSNEGAAYVFVRDAMGAWTEQAKLVQTVQIPFGNLGHSVAISADTVVAGAPYLDVGAQGAAGGAYVFVRTGTTWTEQAQLLASDGLAIDFFGTSVSLVGDRVLVGSEAFDGAGEDSGAAYVFTRSGTTWTETAKVTPANAAEDDFFGHSVALSTDTMLVGAPYRTVSGNADVGTAYVFVERKSAGDQCANAAECASGFCADGVCCDTACGGGDATDCQACSMATGATADGTCAPVAAATVCRAAVGACDMAETCDGTSVACPADALASAGSTCRMAAGACDVAETCDGMNAACPADAFVVAGMGCRAAAGDCDSAESCDGASPACPADAKVAMGTSCRAAAGLCDVAETCDGTTDACPADALMAAGSTCRATAGACDVAETCDGTSSACPADALMAAGSTCRAAAGACDTAETCDGTAAACPVDDKVAAGTECRAAAGTCDTAEACDGTADDCPADAMMAAGTECRASAGACDAAEACDGTAAACPADAMMAAGTECRASAGACDVAEACDGTAAACPSDAKVGAGKECRASKSECDAAEACDGASDECPADAVAPDETVCSDGATNGVCKAGVCTDPGPQGEPPIITGGGLECSVSNTAPTNSSPAPLGLFAMALLALRRRFTKR